MILGNWHDLLGIIHLSSYSGTNSTTIDTALYHLIPKHMFFFVIVSPFLRVDMPWIPLYTCQQNELHNDC